MSKIINRLFGAVGGFVSALWWLGRSADRPERLTTETIVLSGTCAWPASSLLKALFAAHDQIFSGLDEQTFIRYVFHSGAAETKIRIYRRRNRDIVGYAAIHRYHKTISAKAMTIFRAEAGFLPGYRNHASTFTFYTVELLKYVLLHPSESVFYLGMLVHPSSYVVFARYWHTVWPRRGREIPVESYRLMADLADAFGVLAADPLDPLVRRVGWITRQSKPYWEQTNDPDVAFFRQRNPGYRTDMDCWFSCQ